MKMGATEGFMRAQIEQLEKENKELKEKLSEITMVADDEKQSIEHILELEEENRKLKELIMATIKMAFERNGYDAMTHLINEGEKLGLIYVRKSGE